MTAHELVSKHHPLVAFCSTQRGLSINEDVNENIVSDMLCRAGTCLDTVWPTANVVSLEKYTKLARKLGGHAANGG